MGHDFLVSVFNSFNKSESLRALFSSKIKIWGILPTPLFHKDINS